MLSPLRYRRLLDFLFAEGAKAGEAEEIGLLLKLPQEADVLQPHGAAAEILQDVSEPTAVSVDSDDDASDSEAGHREMDEAFTSPTVIPPTEYFY